MGAVPICWSLVMLATPPLTFSSLAKTFTEPPSGESSSFWDEDDDGIQLEVKYHQYYGGILSSQLFQGKKTFELHDLRNQGGI